ncbi:uncharacterized protein DDB_G0284459-like [Zonotrichia leucophrys gambelii]|uniref:uncharacterized protein DDB_G0284459-like n=1 Tax=Zonotrichia leucophrys gambelii TaxID=257770 RepID=UPI003140997B
MRRRRGGGAAPAEACGVWLDTAELKRGRARPLTLRAPRSAGRKQSLGLLPQPGSGDSIGPRHSSSSWQSSILSFFSPQPDDKENIRPAARCEEPRVKILPLPQLEGAQQEPPGAGQGLQGPARAAQTALELRVGSQGLSRASPGAGGHSWDKPWVSPAGTAPGARTALPCPRAGAGGTNPALGAAPGRGCCSTQSPGTAQPLRERGQVRVGPCRESQGCRDRDRDRDWDSAHRDRDSPNRDRDTQSPNRDRGRDWDRDWDSAHRDRDSPNRDRDRDSAHRDRDSPRATPCLSRDRDRNSAHRDSPRQVLCQGSRDRDSAHRDRDTQSPDRDRAKDRASPRDTPSPTWTSPSPSRDRDSPRFPLRVTPSPPEPPELGSEPLFTQDSEGNRVIKHW